MYVYCIYYTGYTRKKVSFFAYIRPAWCIHIESKPIYSNIRTHTFIVPFSIHLPPRFCACSLGNVLSTIIGFSCSTDDDGELLFIFAEWFSVIEIHIHKTHTHTHTNKNRKRTNIIKVFRRNKENLICNMISIVPRHYLNANSRMFETLNAKSNVKMVCKMKWRAQKLVESSLI